MHIDSGWKPDAETAESKEVQERSERADGEVRRKNASWKEENRQFAAREKELQEIFERTFRTSSEDETVRPGWKRSGEKRTVEAAVGGQVRQKTAAAKNSEKEYLLVDGYNIIFAWEELKQLAEANLDSARDRLMDILSNYQGYRPCTLILVFDAYKVEGYALEIQKYHNIHVVYTKEAETADQYIEKVVHQIGRKYNVTVATSDGVEQVVTLGQGGKLISAREFREEVEIVRQQIREEYESRRERRKNYLFDHMDKEMAEEMEEVRLGRKEIK